MRKAKENLSKTKALRVFWEETNHGDTFSAVLCRTHRDGLQNRFPNMRGNGEFFPIEHCERCNPVTVETPLTPETMADIFRRAGGR